jgi:hypothetical protein
MFGPEPEGAFFRVKANPHDFGSYYSVVCNFDDENEEAIKYAYNCENNSPARWDSEVEPAPADSDEPDDYGLAIYPGSTQVVIHQDAYCDFCHKEKPVPAVVDGRTRGGRWAYMCAQHAREKGLGLGEGYGQRLIRP